MPLVTSAVHAAGSSGSGATLAIPMQVWGITLAVIVGLFVLDLVVSATFILDDPADFAGLNEEWVRHFPADRPARQGAHLPFDRMIPGMKVSIAVIAEA